MKKIFNRIKILVAPVILALACLSCSSEETPQLMSPDDFQAEIDGREISLYTLRAADLTMQVTNFGARVVSLWVPDRDGNLEDIVLGYDNIRKYINNPGERFLGACVGRYANRIAAGKFSLDGQDYSLSTYNNGQCLHGGDKGFDRVVWNVESLTENEIVLTYLSEDMEEGFPGNLEVRMTYTLTAENEFKVTYTANTDKKTVVNISHHSFFNLHGEGKGTVLDHELVLNASHVTPIDEVMIPTGEIASVEGTPFDFRTSHLIGERIGEPDSQLGCGNGYDHNWILDRTSAGDLEFAASLYEPASGRLMEVYTDQPAIQFYSGNFFDGAVEGKYGRSMAYRASVALETQKYPDSPNHPEFPSTVLEPDETYRHTCIYRFSTK